MRFSLCMFALVLLLAITCLPRCMHGALVSLFSLDDPFCSNAIHNACFPQNNICVSANELLDDANIRVYCKQYDPNASWHVRIYSGDDMNCTQTPFEDFTGSAFDCVQGNFYNYQVDCGYTENEVYDVKKES